MSRRATTYRWPFLFWAKTMSQNQLVGLINHLPEGVCLIDCKGHIEVINPRMQEYLSLLADGKDVGDIISRIGDYTLHEMLSAREGVRIREVQTGDCVFEAAVNFVAHAHPEQGLGKDADVFAPLGIAGWLNKPLNLRDLAGAVQKALRGE